MNNTLEQMTLENIAKACGGTYVGDDAQRGSEITGAVIDSRQVEPGYLYIPIRGERVDGHRFIPDVFEKVRWQFYPRNHWKIRQDRTFRWLPASRH